MREVGWRKTSCTQSKTCELAASLANGDLERLCAGLLEPSTKFQGPGLRIFSEVEVDGCTLTAQRLDGLDACCLIGILPKTGIIITT